MLVNISYSIDFEKIPEKVEEFVREAQALSNVVMMEKIDSTLQSLNNNNYTDVIKKIDDMREILIKIDMRLNDSVGILRGYTKELVEPTPQKSGRTDVTAPDLSSLQQNLANLKQEINRGSDEDG